MAAHSFFFNLVASAVSSLWFRTHEPSVFKFLAVCFFMSFVHASNDVAISGILISRTITVSLQLIIYLALLSLITLEYRLSSRHPLARFPGPFLAKASKWYMVYHIIMGKRHTTLQSLHAQFGPWVRVGPNELSINDPAAVKPIYLHLSRASSYRAIPAHDETLIMITDREQHTSRRRPWTRAFSSKMLSKYTASTNRRAQQLVKTLEGRRSIDLHHWFALCLMDIIGDLGFSGGIETVASGGDEADWMQMLNLGALVVGVLGQVPWLKDVFLLLPQKGPIETFHKFANEKVEASKARSLSTAENPDILSIILNEHGATNSGPALSAGEAAADASLLMASSIETTSQALTTLFRYALADPAILRRLREEIDSAFSDGDNYADVSSKDTHRTPFLNACIQEALRIMPPAPAGLPRTTGSDGATVLGEFIPPDTTIHVPTFALQRDAANFADPGLFIPTRWLPSETVSSPHNNLAYVPFGAGFGACVGRQLAQQNIRIIAIHVISGLDISLSPDLSLDQFDASYKDRSLWTHDKFLVDIMKR